MASLPGSSKRGAARLARIPRQPAGRSVWLLVLSAVLVAATPAAARAQATGARAQGAPASRWEIEFHGTFATGGGAPPATTTSPVVGQAFTLGDGTTTSRAVPSWYFGEGAAFLNQVLLLRGLTPRIAALDDVTWPSVGRRPGPQFGARVARHVARGAWLELSVDYGLDPMGFPDEARARIETARASFVTAFEALNNSTPTLLPGAAVSSTATLTSGGRRVVTTGILQYRAAPTGASQAYLLVGAGYATTLGEPSSLSMVGNYQLTTPGQTKFDETDALTLRYNVGGSFVWVGGFGVMREVSRRSGYRIEARLMLSSTNLTGLLDTSPSVVIASPTGAAILNSTNPGLQFSTMTGLRTNLSVPPLAGHEVVTASGRNRQWLISAGYFRRF
jgi:hypothetical protein